MNNREHKQFNQDRKNLGDLNLDQENERKEIVPHQSKMTKSILLSLLFLFIFSFIGSFFTTDYRDEGSANEVIFNRVSESTVAGDQLLEEETNAGIEAKDFEVSGVGSDGGEARMLIWDFNFEDFDEVAIFVDGTPVREKLVISDDAYAISIPVPSVVTISGVKDNGAGISYAVKFPNNEKTYFNVVSVGQSNSYTVLPRP